jgi:hypothetical protein
LSQQEYFLDGFTIKLYEVTKGSGISIGAFVSHFIDAIILDSQISQLSAESEGVGKRFHFFDAGTRHRFGIEDIHFHVPYAH